MIEVIVHLLHFCASCVSDANAVPAAGGALGGAAAAAGGMRGLTPMSDLYPPGTSRNPDGSLSWPNPDGTLSNKAPDGTFTVTSPSGAKTTTLRDGTAVSTAADGTKTVKDPDGFTATTSGRVAGPEAPDLPIEEDPIGNAIVGGLATGGMEGIAEGSESGLVNLENNPLVKAADGVADDIVKDVIKDKIVDGIKEALTDPQSPVTYTPNSDGTTTATYPDGGSTTGGGEGP